MASTSNLRCAVRKSSRKTICFSNQTRDFSSTSNQRNQQPQPNVGQIHQRGRKTLQNRIKAMKRGEFPEDIGILPSTFIRPTWSEGPSLFSADWKKRIAMEWLTLKQTARDSFGMFYTYKWGKNPSNGKTKWYPLWKRERLQVARDLHQKLYNAIATHDRGEIAKIALTGLAQQQTSKIKQNEIARAQPSSWTCKYKGILFAERLPFFLQALVPFKAIKVVADRQMDLPIASTMARQFVVRIKSTQTRDRNDGSGPVTRDLTEYMVVQRIIADHKGEEWKVWGTLKPSTYEQLVEIEDPSTKDQSSKNWLQEKMGNVGLNM